MENVKIKLTEGLEPLSDTYHINGQEQRMLHLLKLKMTTSVYGFLSLGNIMHYFNSGRANE